MSTSTDLALEHLILPIVKDLALPKIQSIFKKFKIENTDEESVEKQLNDYLTRRYIKFLTIDTLVFPNRQTALEILYQPLTISCKEGISQKEVEIKIDCYPQDLLPNYARVIIEDTAGMGKSTITKKLFQSIIEQKAGIPVLIELSQIKKKNSILKEIQNQMSQIGKKINQDILLKLINEGDFIFLFDGYDEIALSDREFTIRELHKFIEKAGDNCFLITSRPEESLTSFGDFQKFHVNPLDNEEAYELLKKYDSYSHNKIAASLIEKLKESDDSLQEYLSNPFLVSLLYKSYEYKKDIPVKKSQFYEQVFDALFEAHDFSKKGYLKREKYSNLHKDDFGRVLRYIGYFTSMANKIEYDKNSIIQFIEKAKSKTSDLQFKASDYLNDLIKTVPLFKKEGNNYKWAHKSLQDYFAAKFIWIDAKENRIDILKKIFHDEENQRFFNVLVLYCELDRKGFEHTILKWLLIEFKEFADSHYNKFDKEDMIIKIRISAHFNFSFVFVFCDDDLRKIILMLDNYPNFRLGNVNRESVTDTKVIAYLRETKQNPLQKIIRLILNIYKDLAYGIDIFKGEYNFEALELDQEKVYKLNDKKSDSLNKKNNFELVTMLILRYDIISFYNYNRYLNYDKALTKLKELEKNNPEKEKNELLDW